MKNFNPLLVILLVVLAALSRLLPHPPNVSPLAAMSILAGFALGRTTVRRFGWVLPIGAMILSDLVLGFHDLQVVVYALMVASYAIGTALPKNAGPMRFAGASVVSSSLFFFGSNLAVWLSGALYPMSLEGFAACFIVAIPFFQNTLLGDLAYTGLLIAIYRRFSPQQPATADLIPSNSAG